MTDTTASAKAPGVVARLIAWALRLKIVRAFLRYSESRGPALADSVTYRTLFSVFAAVLLGFSVAALWLGENPAAWQALVDGVSAAIPGLLKVDGGDGLIDPDTITAPAGLSLASAFSLVALVGAAIGAIGTLRTAFRSIGGVVTDDVLFVWVLLRNPLLGIGIGLALAASAAITFLGTAGLGILAQTLGLERSDALVSVGGRLVAILSVFLLDAVIIAVLFRVLSGVRASPRSLWSGAVLGAIGLTVLQQLSGLFIGGASANPLLALFAPLIALLIWINLSAQVILIAGAYIVTGAAEEQDRVREKFGATTFAQRRVRRAEDGVRVATHELKAARHAEKKERAGA